MSSGSVPFDRAADHYDSTRAMDPRAHAQMIERLAAELSGRGRCLEVGVGTGLVSLPLAERGIPMAGIDLSRPMLDKLVEKTRGRTTFPLALADATRLPFRDGQFGAGLVRWVFHLVAGWERAVDELARVVRPGGGVLVHLGGFRRTWALVDRFLEAVGGVPFAVGLDPRHPELLDVAFERHGAGVRFLPAISARDETTIGEYIDEIQSGMHSWTWRVESEVRARVVPGVREWAATEFGSLDEPLEPEREIIWRVYDLP